MAYKSKKSSKTRVKSPLDLSQLLENSDKYPQLQYFMDESKSDVIFIVEGKRVPAVKQFLRMKNKVFGAMFSGDFKDKEVVIKDTTYESFVTLISFLYFDRLLLRNKDNLQLLFDVYQLSNRYEVILLMEEIVGLIEKKIKIDNIKTIAKFAFDNNMAELFEKVVQFCDNNFNELIETNRKDLIELNASTNNRILELMADKYLKLVTQQKTGRNKRKWEPLELSDSSTDSDTDYYNYYG